MNKQAFEIGPVKAGLAAAGLGAAGGGAGYMVARMKAKKALATQAQEFAAYNEQENQALADDAFNQGAEYAGAVTKQSSFKGAVMEKNAGKRIQAIAAKLKKFYVQGLLDRKNWVADAHRAAKSQGVDKATERAWVNKAKKDSRMPMLKNLAAIAGTGAVAGGAGYGAYKLAKTSELLSELTMDKEAGVKDFLKKVQERAGKIYTSGYGMRKETLKSGLTGEDLKKATSAYRKRIALNLLASLGTAGAVGGAGYGIKRAMD